MSRRTVRRAMHEGAIAAEVQMKWSNQRDVTISQDSTSNRNVNYEAKRIKMRVPDYKAGETVPTSMSKPKSPLVGVHSTLDHSSKGSVMSWEQTVAHHMPRARTSPLGQRTGMKANLRLFYKWLKGIHGDHANNEKAICSDLDGKKTDSAIVDLAVTAALEMNAQEVLRISEAWQKQKIEDAGGQEAFKPSENTLRVSVPYRVWRSLSANDRGGRNPLHDGLKRVLDDRLAPRLAPTTGSERFNASHGVVNDWEIGDCLAQWWRPNFETFM
ncbi:hypothetical protein BDZ89DRAFT_1050845, partial [Hymenopellis radicata]